MKFKAKIRKIVPRVDELKLSEQQWQDLETSLRNQSLNTLRVMQGLAKVTKKSYDEIITLTAKAQPSRVAKTKQIGIPSRLTQRSHQKRKRLIEGESNPCVYAPHDPNAAVSTPLKKLQTKVLNPVTPEHGMMPEAVSPNTNTRYRLFCSHSINQQPIGQIFIPATPIGTKAQDGKLSLPHLPKSARTLFKQEIPNYQRAEPIECDLTLEDIEQREGMKRLRSQNTLTGITCKAVFTLHMKHAWPKQDLPKDGKFHWGHLIAYCLGGAHDKENLTPMTDTANYNILNTIERPLLEKLKSKQTDLVTMKVTPIFIDQSSLIPIQLIFKLSWKENNNIQELEIPISTTSFRRYNHAMIDSKEALSQQSNRG